MGFIWQSGLDWGAAVRESPLLGRPAEPDSQCQPAYGRVAACTTRSVTGRAGTIMCSSLTQNERLTRDVEGWRLSSLKPELRLLRHSSPTMYASSRAEQCIGSISLRRSPRSPLIILGKRPKLARNPWISHGLGSADQRPRSFRVLLALHHALHADFARRHVGPFRSLRLHKMRVRIHKIGRSGAGSGQHRSPSLARLVPTGRVGRPRGFTYAPTPPLMVLGKSLKPVCNRPIVILGRGEADSALSYIRCSASGTPQVPSGTGAADAFPALWFHNLKKSPEHVEIP
jgi:hypothetical protein